MLVEGGQQARHGEAGVGRVPEDGSLFDAVEIRAALPGVGETAVLLKIGNDLLDSALGEPASRGDVTDTGARIVGDRGQHSVVVGQKVQPPCPSGAPPMLLSIVPDVHVFKRVKMSSCIS